MQNHRHSYQLEFEYDSDCQFRFEVLLCPKKDSESTSHLIFNCSCDSGKCKCPRLSDYLEPGSERRRIELNLSNIKTRTVPIVILCRPKDDIEFTDVHATHLEIVIGEHQPHIQLIVQKQLISGVLFILSEKRFGESMVMQENDENNNLTDCCASERRGNVMVFPCGQIVNACENCCRRQDYPVACQHGIDSELGKAMFRFYREASSYEKKVEENTLNRLQRPQSQCLDEIDFRTEIYNSSNKVQIIDKSRKAEKEIDDKIVNHEEIDLQAVTTSEKELVQPSLAFSMYYKV